MKHHERRNSAFTLSRYLRLTAVGLLLTAPLTAIRAQTPVVKRSMVVSPTWLQEHLPEGKIVVLQVDRDREAYDAGHIPGARFVEYSQFITTRSELRTELPPADRLKDLVESLGISTETQVVVYGDLLSSARLYFTLDYLGHGDRTALLDGGLEAWRDAGGAVTSELPTGGLGTFRPSIQSNVVIGSEEVRKRLDDSGMVLVDARSRDEYTGARAEESLPRTGHLPGAVNLDWSTTVKDGRLASPSELRNLLHDAGVDLHGGEEVVPYCQVGTRASMIYFVAKYLGHRVRLYDGSMNEWSARPDLPLVSGDQRGGTIRSPH